ncbi:MAG: M14 metallopeptidase family protein [Acidobacteriota bacterium]
MKREVSVFKLFFLFIATLTVILIYSDEKIPAPKEILGFEPGEDFKLAKWNQILDYFDSLDKASDRIEVIDLGKSTLGRRFIFAVISSSENLKNLDRIKEIQRKLQDPRKTVEEEVESLIKEGKAIVAISCAIHSTEIASTLFSMRLAYRLVSSNDPEVLKILNNTVLLLVPSVNPDGIDMVVEWYYRNLGTQYEASSMPWLYHYYTGHDNNRDWFMITQKETEMWTKILYREFFPIVVWDVHQMGQRGPRLFIPPYYDPTNPNIEPLLLRELNLLCSEAAFEFTKRGKKGIATNMIFDSWYNMANRAAPIRHNAIGILTEAASCNLASPLFLRKSDLQDRGRGIYSMDIQSSYLEPWEGGWWRLKDIIEYEEIFADSILRRISEDKEKYMYNYYRFALNQIEKGKSEPPYAYIIPKNQRDLPTAIKLINVLQRGGAEVYEAKKEFEADGIEFPSGTFIVPLSQPYRSFIKDLLEMKQYPARDLGGGRLEYPYDESTWTLPLQMGVKCIEIKKPFSAELQILPYGYSLHGKIKIKGKRYFLLKNQTNEESTLINQLLKKNYNVEIALNEFSVSGEKFNRGTVIILNKGEVDKLLIDFTKSIPVEILGTDELPRTKTLKMKNKRIGVYQSFVPNMDEGWLRFVLEKFDFEFKVVQNSEIKAGNLAEKFDVIIIPPMPLKIILEGKDKGEVSPEYAGGIGIDGTINIRDFVRNGGKLITIGSSSDLPIEYFGIDVSNALKKELEKPRNQRSFFCPGSIFINELTHSTPVAFGLPKEISIFYNEEPVFEVKKGTSVMKFPEFNSLLSGIVKEEKMILGKSTFVDVPYEKGNVILIGFDVLHHAQSHGTFKLLFNAIQY